MYTMRHYKTQTLCVGDGANDCKKVCPGIHLNIVDADCMSILK